MTGCRSNVQRWSSGSIIWALYALAVLPMFTTGHLVEREAVRLVVLALALTSVAALHWTARPLGDGWAIAILTGWVAFVAAQYDQTLTDVYVGVAHGAWFLVTGFSCVGLAWAGAEGRGAPTRWRFGWVDGLACALTILCVALIVGLGDSDDSAPSRWIGAAKVVGLCVSYLMLSMVVKSGTLSGRRSDRRSVQWVLVAAAAGLLGAAGLVGLRLWQADRLMQEGMQSLSHGDLDGSIARLEKAAAMSNRQDPAILAVLAQTYGSAGMSEAALGALGAADALESSSTQVWLAIAAAYETAGRPDLAAARLRRLGDDQEAYESLLTLCLRSERREEARSLLEKMPNSGELDLGSGHDSSVAARLLMSLGRHPEAYTLLERALSSGDGGPEPWIALGEYHEWRGQADSMAVCARAALEVDPGASGALRLQARALASTGDSARAVASARRALAVDSTDVIALEGALTLTHWALPEEAENWRRWLSQSITTEVSSSAWPRNGEMGWNTTENVPLVLSSGRVTIAIAAMGTQAGHEYARFDVSLVDLKMGMSHYLGDFTTVDDWASYTVSMDLAHPGSYALRVHFSNDGVTYDSSGAAVEDRNLYIGDVLVERD